MRKRLSVDIPSRLRELREKADLTQEEIGRRAGITAKYLSQVENGHSNPTIAVLARIVEQGIGVSLGVFFAADDNDTQHVSALLARMSAPTRRKALKVLRAMRDD